MKRILLSIFGIAFCMTSWSQFSLPALPEIPNTFTTDVPEDSIFIRTRQETMFSNNVFDSCFIPCDLNGDGIVTFGEAAQATMLDLSHGGRKNIIGNYDFLKYFPNLTHLHLGNTTLEEIDLTRNPRLEELVCCYALWLKRIKLAKGCTPRIYYPDMEGDFTVTIVP